MTGRSVTHATFVVEPSYDASPALVLTEQGAYLDGHDTSAQRQHATGELLDALGAVLGQQPADRR